MAKQLSSIDIHYLVEELKILIGSRIDKIYNQGKEEIYFQLYKANDGKKLAKFILGKAVFLTESKDVESSPSDFCMALRKHLEGMFLDEITQVRPERIIKLVFHSKDEERILYMEFFGKGNLILCNGNIIVDCILRQKFRDREILPKQQYSHPIMKYDFFSIDDLSDFFGNSQKESIVTALATELGIGGLYSEEVCLLSKIEKTAKPNDLSKKQQEVMVKSLKTILSKKLQPLLVYDDAVLVDMIPFPLTIYGDQETKDCASFSFAIETFFSSAAKPKKSSQQKKIEELERIIDEQQQSIISLEAQEADLKRKGEALYENYTLIDDLLSQIKEAKKTHSWEEIKKKLEKHPKLNNVDLKDKRVEIDL